MDLARVHGLLKGKMKGVVVKPAAALSIKTTRRPGLLV
jgi:hypothetical protein